MPSHDPSRQASPPDARPWWREPMVWLVLAGPLAVVLAGVVTAVIAVRGADLALPTSTPEGSQAPAVQARNHVMTPAPGR
jgi:uncharacterized protein